MILDSRKGAKRRKEVENTFYTEGWELEWVSITKFRKFYLTKIDGVCRMLLY